MTLYYRHRIDHYKVSLLLTRRWFYHAVSVFLQSVLLLVVAYTTFYYRVDNFQVSSELRAERSWELDLVCMGPQLSAPN